MKRIVKTWAVGTLGTAAWLVALPVIQAAGLQRLRASSPDSFDGKLASAAIQAAIDEWRVYSASV